MIQTLKFDSEITALTINEANEECDYEERLPRPLAHDERRM